MLITSAAGLAWDWVNQKLYWTDYCDDDIEVSDPTSGARRVLFDLDLDAPHAIVVDPITGYVNLTKGTYKCRSQISLHATKEYVRFYTYTIYISIHYSFYTSSHYMTELLKPK